MRTFFLLVALVPVISFAQVARQLKKTSGFVITGAISDLKAGTTVKLSSANTGAEFATAKVQQRKKTIRSGGKTIVKLESIFVLNGKLDEPELCLLMVGEEKPFVFYLENAKVTVSGNAADMNGWQVKGSRSQEDFKVFETTFTPLAQSLNAAATTINAMPPGAERDKMMETYTGIQKNIQNRIDTFIAARPSSFVSAFVLQVMMSFDNNPLVAEQRLNQLDTTVQHSSIGKMLAAEIAENKIGAVGTEALEFSQPDTSGTQVSLSSFRGRYVLVDFWASWCGPCRNENPNVVETFEKFKDKNFTVLGVSLDRPGRKADWMKAIGEDHLAWTHVSDLQFWDNAAAKLYHIQSIPQNILVDPQGKIIGRNLRGPALREKLCEVLGCTE